MCHTKCRHRGEGVRGRERNRKRERRERGRASPARYYMSHQQQAVSPTPTSSPEVHGKMKWPAEKKENRHCHIDFFFQWCSTECMIYPVIKPFSWGLKGHDSAQADFRAWWSLIILHRPHLLLGCCIFGPWDPPAGQVVKSLSVYCATLCNV